MAIYPPKITYRPVSHNGYDYPVGNVKSNVKQAGKAIVQGGGVWNQKNKNDKGSGNFQLAGVKPLAEKVRHGFCGKMLGHNSGPPS